MVFSVVFMLLKNQVVAAGVVVVQIDLGEINVAAQLCEQKIDKIFVVHGGVKVHHESVKRHASTQDQYPLRVSLLVTSAIQSVIG